MARRVERMERVRKVEPAAKRRNWWRERGRGGIGWGIRWGEESLVMVVVVVVLERWVEDGGEGRSSWVLRGWRGRGKPF